MFHCPCLFRASLCSAGRRALLGAAIVLFLSPAIAQTSGNRPSLDALRAACSDDAARLCSGVQAGGGRVIACLKQHQDALSSQCRQAAGLPPKPNAAPEVQSPPQSSPTPAAPSAPAPASNDPMPATSAPVGPPTNVAGEKFVRRVIPDPAHDNVTAATVHLPEKSTLASKVEWHYDWADNLLAFSAHAANPANAEAFFVYPLLRFESDEVAPQYRQYVRGKQPQPGQRESTGVIAMPLQPPVRALIAFIKQVRPDAGNLKWIGQQNLPDLSKALNLDPWPNSQGVAIKISYDFNGQPVEEAFFGVYYSSQTANEAKTVGQLHMDANAIKTTVWGLRALQSFRAPAGTLDKRMPVFCLIAKSMVYNPQWLQMGRSIYEQTVAAVNQKIQQGYDQIRGRQAAMQQMQAQERSFNATVAKQDAALRSPGFDDSWLRTSSGGSGGGSPRSSSDHFSDNIRGVDTLNDPSTGGTTQLSNAGQYHFTDGFGNYRTTDDPNYTPEKSGEVGSWTQMTAAP